MGISVEEWRSRIGRNCSGDNNSLVFILPASNLISGIYVSITIILLLLVIGNVELNPGPEDQYACFLCNFKAKTPNQNIYHQQIHSETFNFRFRCPLPNCQHSYDTFKCVQAHLSHHGTVNIDEVADPATINSKCAYCEEPISTNRAYCKHLKKHLKEGLHVSCPFSACSRSNEFSSLSIFSTHLSQCHPGWLQDYGDSALHQAPQVNLQEDYEPYLETNNLEGSDDEVELQNDDSDSSSTCSSERDEEYGLDHDEVVRYIAHFYAMIEGKKIVPASTVDALAKKLALISEILQEKLKRDLKRTLTQAGLSETVTQDVIDSVLTMDPLYNAHHVQSPGATLLTSSRRNTYYIRHFKLQDFIEINLKKNPQDTEDKVQYIDVKETLSLLLEDPSVQRVLEKSFSAPESNGTHLKDYTDGSVFRESSTPMKRIDLLLFMDAFNCANPLGSAKRKHKIHGMYMTLGNFLPYMRSFLKSMRLVLLVNDKSLKKSEKMFKKCFQKLLKDLKYLEEHGIDFKGEKIPFRLQFIQGDNLGQNTLGGFVESFTSTHFCRFCDLHYDQFKEDVAVQKPKPRFGAWRTKETYNENLNEQKTQNLHNSCGVKRNSPFHKLDHFHVCGPRLPPCIGHDLFVDGVVDNDVRSMIEYFIKSGWFTLPELNMRIKRFKYFGKDSANKPAELPAESLKLGGHAIQNWTLFRLLPLLIHDKIKPEDKIWKIYLLLKSIIELMSAPALSVDQIEEMRQRIKKYWKSRNVLENNNYKPKHHMFSHAPDLYLFFGPLIFMWTLAFEHRHQFFKRVAKICQNFINLGSLLAKRCLLLQAYQNMGPMFPDKPVLCGTSPLQDEVLEKDLQEFVNKSKFERYATIVKSLTLNEIKYKVDDWLLLGNTVIDDQKLLLVGQIKAIVFDMGVCTAIIKKYQSYEMKQCGLYCVNATDSQTEISSVILDQLENPVPHPMYNLQGELLFSLKHVFSECKCTEHLSDSVLFSLLLNVLF